MSPVSRPVQRARALLRAAALAALVVAAAGPGSALAAAGDVVLVDPPAPVLPDDSAKPIDAVLSGNGRYVAAIETRPACISLPPAWDYFGECYPEQHAWRYDLQTGARVKIDKGPRLQGAVDPVVLSEDGSTAAWTWGRYGPDSDASDIFVSQPGTGKSGVTIRPTDTYLPDYLRRPSLSADGEAMAFVGDSYAGSCSSRAFSWHADSGGGAGSTKPLSNGCADWEAEYDIYTDDPGLVRGEGNGTTISADGTTAFFLARGQFYRYDIAARTFQTIPIDQSLRERIVGPFAVSGNGLALVFMTKQEAPSTGYDLWATDLAADGTTILGTGRIAQSSVAPAPAQALEPKPALSYDGQTVAFNWPANPVSGEPSGSTRTYWYQRNAGRLEIASKRAGTGTPFAVASGYGTRGPGISSDGRYVTFIADDAKQAVPDDATPTGRHVVRVDMLGSADDTTAPARPTSIKLTQTASGTQLSWPAVDDPSEPVIYRIRQRPIAGASHSLVGSKMQLTNSIAFRGLVAGQPYRFAVTAEDAEGNRSTGTTISFIAPGTPDPTPPTITAPEKPYVGTAEQQLGGPFTINGADLANATGVLIGGKPATGLTITGTSITGTAPRVSDAASLPVVVIGPFGAKAAGRFFYRPPGVSETSD
ncbi:MAG: fibronectin type III domain-containing protein [Solirubrobacteraceae bacterium]|nr:fibronectin type III domain-containing protein [Solirubrobacteraceae bacterium]